MALTSLPNELLTSLLPHIVLRDVAALRLTSRQFHALATKTFLDLAATSHEVLTSAIASQNHAFLAHLLRHCVEPASIINARALDGMTLFNTAVFHDNVEAIRLLHSYGADVTIMAHPTNGGYPLGIAALRGNVKATEVLLDINEAKVQIELPVGWNQRLPLHMAAEKECLEVVKLLLQHGADVGCKDRYGRTPLHIASSRGRIDVVRTLLTAGASVDAREVGKTPLAMAAGCGLAETVAVLLEAGSTEIICCWADGAWRDQIAVLIGHGNVVRVLLEWMKRNGCLDLGWVKIATELAVEWKNEGTLLALLEALVKYEEGRRIWSEAVMKQFSIASRPRKLAHREKARRSFWESRKVIDDIFDGSSMNIVFN